MPAVSVRRAALVGYALAIFAVAALPGASSAAAYPDKVLHALGYAALVAFFAWARLPGPRPVAVGFTFAIAHGALVEGMQSLLPWRTAEWGDLAADAVGAGAAALVWSVARRGPETAPEENR